MNSESDFPKPAKTPSEPTQTRLFVEKEKPTPGKLVFELEIDGRLPSWNDLLGMEQWARYAFKRTLERNFMSALQASAVASSTKTTLQKSIMLTYAATLECCLQMRQEQRKLRSAKKKLAAKSESLFESKSTKLNPPF